MNTQVTLKNGKTMLLFLHINNIYMESKNYRKPGNNINKGGLMYE